MMRKLPMAMLVACALASPGLGLAQVDLGAQGNWGDDSEWGLGGRLSVGLPAGPSTVAAIGSFDWFFPDQPTGVDITYWEANANLVYFFLPISPVLSPYGGLGLNVARTEVKPDQAGVGPGSGSGEESTDLGLNLLVGANLNVGVVKPFGEARFEIEGGKQFVLTVGAYITLGAGRQSIR